MTEPDVSLWQALGISVDDALDQAPDDVWASAVQHAVDPSTPEVDSSLVPEMDDSDSDPFEGGGDLAALLHDDPAAGRHGHDTSHDIDLGDGFDHDGFGAHHHDDGDGIDLHDSGL
ncbi:hypothetical protein AB4Z09_25400 [Rhodococcus sp. TAF43]|uniref:hypothetical protein n=1 Tax=Rhodococcus sp. TAF43 TaxID=3237483 RepID=UPI003F9726D6